MSMEDYICLGGGPQDIWVPRTTHDRVCAFLRRQMSNQIHGVGGYKCYRFRLHYGDPETGKASGASVVGYIRRRLAGYKKPVAVVLHHLGNPRGHEILANRIVKIEYANKKEGGVHWQHELYHEDPAEFNEVFCRYAATVL